MTKFKKYRNKETGEEVSGVFEATNSPSKNWGYRWRLRFPRNKELKNTTSALFRLKKNFNQQYQLIKNENDK